MAAFEVPMTECELYAVVSAFDTALSGRVIQERCTARSIPSWTVIVSPALFQAGRRDHNQLRRHPSLRVRFVEPTLADRQYIDCYSPWLLLVSRALLCLSISCGGVKLTSQGRSQITRTREFSAIMFVIFACRENSYVVDRIIRFV